jgi:hypothetical protein
MLKYYCNDYEIVIKTDEYNCFIITVTNTITKEIYSIDIYPEYDLLMSDDNFLELFELNDKYNKINICNFDCNCDCYCEIFLYGKNDYCHKIMINKIYGFLSDFIEENKILRNKILELENEIEKIKYLKI